MKYPGDPTTAERNYFYQLGLHGDATKRLQIFLDGTLTVQHQPKTDALPQATTVTAQAPMKLAEGDMQQVTVYDADGTPRLIEGVRNDGTIAEIPRGEHDVVLGGIAKLLHDARQRM